MTTPNTNGGHAAGPKKPPLHSATLPARATFANAAKPQTKIPVQFNPMSLQMSLSSTLESSAKQDKAQYVAKNSSKLTMDLIFDTTDTDTSVRAETGQIAQFIEADPKKGAPPTVLFEWGSFAFQGIVESYRETIDFFSSEGMPLRASVNLTMTAQTVVFSADKAAKRGEAVDVPSAAGNASEVAAAGGNPDAGRGLAATNGLESMRFSTGPLTIDASVKLGGPVAFASAGAGLGIGVSAGASSGVGGGASFGATAGASFGVNAGAGATLTIAGPAFGGSASRGVPATMGAFAGLRIGPQLAGPPLDPTRLMPRPQLAVVAAGGQAAFGIGGQMVATGSAGIVADAGGGGGPLSAQAGVRFD